MFKYFITFITFISFLSINCSNTNQQCSYNTVYEFEKGKVLKFKDFDLVFTGERKVQKMISDGSKINFNFFDFKISNASGSFNVSWTSGTGDIAPQPFEFNGKGYLLELKNSELLKKNLAENELVIVKK